MNFAASHGVPVVLRFAGHKLVPPTCGSSNEMVEQTGAPSSEADSYLRLHYVGPLCNGGSANFHRFAVPCVVLFVSIAGTILSPVDPSPMRQTVVSVAAF